MVPFAFPQSTRTARPPGCPMTCLWVSGWACTNVQAALQAACARLTCNARWLCGAAAACSASQHDAFLQPLLAGHPLSIPSQPTGGSIWCATFQRAASPSNSIPLFLSTPCFAADGRQQLVRNFQRKRERGEIDPYGDLEEGVHPDWTQVCKSSSVAISLLLLKFKAACLQCNGDLEDGVHPDWTQV